MSAAPKLESNAAEAGLRVPPRCGVLGKGVAGRGVRGGELLLVSLASQLFTASKSAGPQLSGRQAGDYHMLGQDQAPEYCHKRRRRILENEREKYVPLKELLRWRVRRMLGCDSIGGSGRIRAGAELNPEGGVVDILVTGEACWVGVVLPGRSLAERNAFSLFGGGGGGGIEGGGGRVIVLVVLTLGLCVWHDEPEGWYTPR